MLTIIINLRLANSKELANNIKAERENDTRKAENKRNKLKEQARNNGKHSADQPAQAASEPNLDNDLEKDLDLRADGEESTKGSDDDLEQ